MTTKEVESVSLNNGDEFNDANYLGDETLIMDETLDTSILEIEENQAWLSSDKTKRNPHKRVLESFETDNRSFKKVKVDINEKISCLSEHIESNERAEHQFTSNSIKRTPIGDLPLRTHINKLKQEVDLLQKVKKYRNALKIDPLIEKWRQNGQMAANHLFNDSKIKIEQMGGMGEFKHREKRTKQRQKMFEFDDSMIYELEDYMETSEFKGLDKYDRSEIAERKRELEERQQNIEKEADSEVEDTEGEFTMEELFKQMKMKISLFF